MEQSTTQLIDSKVEEVKMPIVESVDELSKLDLPKGGVAAVEKVGEPVVVNLEDCYLSADTATDWDKYTVIRGFSEKGVPSNAVGQIHLYSDKSMENGLTIACGEGKYFYYKIANSVRYYSSLEEVNEYLASGEYRLVFGYYIENVSAYVTLYSAFPQPNLYIKGDSWEMLTKETVVNSEDALDGLSVPYGSIAKVAKWQYGEVDPYQCYSITNESSHDDDTIKRIWDKLTRISHIDITYPETPPTVMPAWPTILLHGYASTSDDVIQITYYQESYKIAVGNSGSTNIVSIDEINTILQEKDYRLIDLTNDKYARPFIEEHITFYSPNANITANAYIKGETWTRLLKEGDVTGGSSITIDSELSDTSENPVQNKVVTEAFGILEEHLAVHSKQISSLGLSMATKEELNAKQNTISDLETIRSGAAKGATALQSVPSEYVTETELSQKGYATTSQLNNKQDVISDLATIRSNASKGATALQSVPSTYATKTDVDNAIASAITNTLNTEV